MPKPAATRHTGHRVVLRSVVAALAATPALSAGSAPALGAADQPAPAPSATPLSQIAWSQFVDPEFSSAAIVSRAYAGGPVHTLTTPGVGAVDIDPMYSADGRWILFERDFPDGTTGVGVVRGDGTGERILDLGCVDPCFADVGPTWTPDGRHIAFTRVSGLDLEADAAASAVLWTSDLDGGQLTRLSEPGIDGTYEDYRASFAPGGYVVFVRLRWNGRDGVEGAVFRMAPDGTDVRRLTPWSIDADEPWVSPAESGATEDLVVFETYGHGAPEGTSQAIGTVPATCQPAADCEQQVDLLTSPTDQPVEHFNPAWSPDGKRIAYVLFEPLPDDVRGDIWTMRWNGADQRPFETSPLFDFRPTWAQIPPK